MLLRKLTAYIVFNSTYYIVKRITTSSVVPIKIHIYRFIANESVIHYAGKCSENCFTLNHLE